MITEDYVSYEVAKLLKEKGFDEICTLAYEELNQLKVMMNWKVASDYLPCPTHQMAMKWLREKEIDISITPEFSTEAEPRVDFFCGYSAAVCKMQNGEYIDEFIIKKEEECGYAPFDTYEEAVEAALKYVLENLIEL